MSCHCCVASRSPASMPSLLSGKLSMAVNSELDKQQLCFELTDIQTDKLDFAALQLHSSAATLRCLMNVHAYLLHCLRPIHTQLLGLAAIGFWSCATQCACTPLMQCQAFCICLTTSKDGSHHVVSYMQCRIGSHHVVSPMQCKAGSHHAVSHMQCRNGSHHIVSHM